MLEHDIRDRIQKLVHPFRITKGESFRLKEFDPADTGGMTLDKAQGAELVQLGTKWLAEEQDMLYAQDRWSLLLIFQAMDAAGKDSTIKHVMSGVNPQGCQVFSFKQPSSEELDHDFMWRYVIRLPERGRIGIFNRSYYEEVLVVRVHPEVLRREKLPPQLVGEEIWDERLADIARFEDYVSRQGTKILKFFLNVSRKEQKRRFEQRLDEPEKNWNTPLPTSWSASSGTITWRPSRRRSARQRQSTPPGSSCLPITNGSRGSWSRRRLWMLSELWACHTRSSTPRSRKSSWRPGQPLPTSGDDGKLCSVDARDDYQARWACPGSGTALVAGIAAPGTAAYHAHAARASLGSEAVFPTEKRASDLATKPCGMPRIP